MAEQVYAPAETAEFDPVASFAALKTNLEAIFDRVSPTGLVQSFGGSAAPAGWLLCNGQAISRTGYPALFTAIGTTYGVGDGSTTFNVPDMRGRTLVGFDAAQSEFDRLGKTGGAKTHTLGIGEMPAHGHKLHYWDVIVSQGANTGNIGAFNTGNLMKVAGEDADQNRRVQNEGGGGAHNNLQPFMTVNYIIKAL